MNEMNPIPPFDLTDVNRAWSSIIADLVIGKLSLEKENQQLRLELTAVTADNADLKTALTQTKQDLLACQGKNIIDAGT